jgi:hypothetical protein
VLELARVFVLVVVAARLDDEAVVSDRPLLEAHHVLYENGDGRTSALRFAAQSNAASVLALFRQKAAPATLSTARADRRPLVNPTQTIARPGENQ